MFKHSINIEMSIFWYYLLHPFGSIFLFEWNQIKATYYCWSQVITEKKKIWDVARRGDLPFQR